ncbi:hypothetical protein [Paraburkholderia phytofirmans]|uniref:hypothetical protein n=1 Tax=Paraburkholderia phytofirmans TaxID=261302 RepID=UPI001427AE2D|nr:hypothetical protein [Paraburkholderia phytofirmans]
MNVPGSTVATSGPFIEGVGDSLAIAVSRSKLEKIATSRDNGIAGNKCRFFARPIAGRLNASTVYFVSISATAARKASR